SSPRPAALLRRELGGPARLRARGLPRGPPRGHGALGARDALLRPLPRRDQPVPLPRLLQGPRPHARLRDRLPVCGDVRRPARIAPAPRPGAHALIKDSYEAIPSIRPAVA